MDNVFNWLIAHGTDVLAVIAAVQALLVVIVKLTPSQSDDAIVGKIVAVLAKIASILSVAAKPETDSRPPVSVPDKTGK